LSRRLAAKPASDEAVTRLADGFAGTIAPRRDEHREQALERRAAWIPADSGCDCTTDQGTPARRRPSSPRPRSPAGLAAQAIGHQPGRRESADSHRLVMVGVDGQDAAPGNFVGIGSGRAGCPARLRMGCVAGSPCPHAQRHVAVDSAGSSGSAENTLIAWKPAAVARDRRAPYLGRWPRPRLQGPSRLGYRGPCGRPGSDGAIAGWLDVGAATLSSRPFHCRQGGAAIALRERCGVEHDRSSAPWSRTLVAA
jgi:hypothetical protein